MSSLVAVILAAGKGTRMRSKLPKVLHKVGGKAMLQHVIDASTAAGADDKVVIIGHGAELVEEMVAGQAKTALQAEQLGTGHAVLQTKEALSGFTGTAMILCGDTPLLDGEELKKFYEAHKASGASATVMTAIMDNPTGYGRIIRDNNGDVCGIVEQKDATEEQKAVKEINTGIYCIECPLMFEVLETITPNNAQGEYYLTDIVEVGKNHQDKFKPGMKFTLQQKESYESQENIPKDEELKPEDLSNSKPSAKLRAAKKLYQLKEQLLNDEISETDRHNPSSEGLRRRPAGELHRQPRAEDGRDVSFAHLLLPGGRR